MALEAAWFQKFLVHRRLRPEEFGGCAQNLKTGAAKYPINPELLDSKVLEIVFKNMEPIFYLWLTLKDAQLIRHTLQAMQPTSERG